jgi:hypothetical protein
MARVSQMPCENRNTFTWNYWMIKWAKLGGVTRKNEAATQLRFGGRVAVSGVYRNPNRKALFGTP